MPKGSHQSEKILTSTKGLEAISKERLINRQSWRRDLLTWRSDIATLDSIRTRLQHSGHIKIDEVVTTYSTVKISCIGLLMFCYIFYQKQTRFQKMIHCPHQIKIICLLDFKNASVLQQYPVIVWPIAELYCLFIPSGWQKSSTRLHDKLDTYDWSVSKARKC